MFAAPPVPHGRAALDAWRELDRGVRRELMRGDRPHPDPTTAVIAVGYARTMLGRSRLRQTLPLLPVLLAWAVGLGLAVAAAAPKGHSPLLFFAGALPAGVLMTWWSRRRRLALHRLESLHAAALWVTERSDPLPAAPFAAGEAPELAVRAVRRAVWRAYAITAGLFTLCTAGAASLDPLLGLVVGCLLAFLLVSLIAAGLRQTNGRPFVHLRADGLAFRSAGLLLPWTAFTEIRIMPFRNPTWATGGRKPKVVVFVAADPHGLITSMRPSTARRARASLKAYGGPMAVADQALDRTAEEMAAAAAALSGLPVRRFDQ